MRIHQHFLSLIAWGAGSCFHLLHGGSLPPPPLPADNLPSTVGIKLGHKLFYDQILSRGNFLACANCHMQEYAFADPRMMSVGVHGDLTARTSMPLFNLAYATQFFWDGRAPSLRAQALIPIEHKTEMDERLDNVIRKLNRRSPYPELFAAAFGEGGITPERLGLALEQFMLTLVSDQAKYDQVQDGSARFSAPEQRGHDLFFAEKIPGQPGSGTSCTRCHKPPHFTTHGFANNGIDPAHTDPGLEKVSRRKADRGKFKIPSLRNIGVTKHYMHNSRFETLQEVVEYYNSGVRPGPHLDPRMAVFEEGLGLSKQQQADLVGFLHSLTDHSFLNNPAHAEPKRGR
ncbi:MAG: cytochrome c peroxidase [Verrucomicrobiota bacterium]